MKIIQITDTHLLPPGIAINGVDPEKQLLRQWPISSKNTLTPIFLS